MRRSKLLNGVNMKIAAATSVVIFTLLVSFMGVYAWFEASRNVDNSTDSFEIKKNNPIKGITIHECYGLDTEDNWWGFNLEAFDSISFDEGSQTGSVSFEMGTYTKDNQHHPVLLLFEVSGGQETITAITDLPYLAVDKPSYNTTKASYSAMTNDHTLANGVVVFIENDSTHHNRDTIYKVNLIDGVYAYDLLWLDIKAVYNPLSSIIESYFFEYNYNPTADESKIKTANFMLENAQHEIVPTEKRFIPFAKGDLDSTKPNRSAFLTLDQETDRPVFDNSCEFYNGDTSGLKYVGIIIDYNIISLDYIYSHFLGNDYLDDNLGFYCDWRLEI